MSDIKKITVTCPVCGCEYLPAEIYLPDNFLGKPTDIERGVADGRILGFVGTSMDRFEEYVCDRCGSKFKVEARVSFKTTVSDDRDFGDDYISYNRRGLKMVED